MPRQAKPFPFKDRYWVTKAGGRGMKILCDLDPKAKDRGQAKAERELRRYLIELEREGQAGANCKGYTVAQLIGEFLEFYSHTRPEKTLKYYQWTLGELARRFGALKVADLTEAHANQYIVELKKTGKRGQTTRDGKKKNKPTPMGNASVNHCVTAGKTLLNYAVRHKVIVANPWRGVEKLPEQGRERLVTDAEFEKLLTACERCVGYHGMISREEAVQLMKDILLTLRYTALRPKELRILRWDHLHFDASFIVIPKDEHKTSSTAKKPKDRTVPILPEVLPILERRRQRYGEQPRVFPAITGKEWGDSQLARRFRDIREWAGIEADARGEDVTLYSLRHTRLTEAGVIEQWPVHVLKELSGHTTDAMLSRYVHAGRDDLKRFAERGAKLRKAFKAEAG